MAKRKKVDDADEDLQQYKVVQKKTGLNAELQAKRTQQIQFRKDIGLGVRESRRSKKPRLRKEENVSDLFSETFIEALSTIFDYEVNSQATIFVEPIRNLAKKAVGYAQDQDFGRCSLYFVKLVQILLPNYTISGLKELFRDHLFSSFFVGIIQPCMKLLLRVNGGGYHSPLKCIAEFDIDSKALTSSKNGDSKQPEHQDKYRTFVAWYALVMNREYKTEDISVKQLHELVVGLADGRITAIEAFNIYACSILNTKNLEEQTQVEENNTSLVLEERERALKKQEDALSKEKEEARLYARELDSLSESNNKFIRIEKDKLSSTKQKLEEEKQRFLAEKQAIAAEWQTLNKKKSELTENLTEIEAKEDYQKYIQQSVKLQTEHDNLRREIIDLDIVKRSLKNEITNLRESISIEPTAIAMRNIEPKSQQQLEREYCVRHESTVQGLTKRLEENITEIANSNHKVEELEAKMKATIESHQVEVMQIVSAANAEHQRRIEEIRLEVLTKYCIRTRHDVDINKVEALGWLEITNIDQALQNLPHRCTHCTERGYCEHDIVLLLEPAGIYCQQMLRYKVRIWGKVDHPLLKLFSLLYYKAEAESYSVPYCTVRWALWRLEQQNQDLKYMESRIDSIDSIESQLEEQVAENKSLNDKFNIQLKISDNLQNDLNFASNTVNEIESKLNRLQANILSKENEITRLQNVDEKREEHIKHIESLLIDEGQRNNIVNDYRLKLSNQRTQISELFRTIEGLEIEIGDLRRMLEQEKSLTSTCQKENSILCKRIEDVGSEGEYLKNKIQHLEHEMGDLSRMLEQEKSSNFAYQRESSILCKEIEGGKSEIAHLKNKIEGLESRNLLEASREVGISQKNLAEELKDREDSCDSIKVPLEYQIEFARAAFLCKRIKWLVDIATLDEAMLYWHKRMIQRENPRRHETIKVVAYNWSNINLRYGRVVERQLLNLGL